MTTTSEQPPVATAPASLTADVEAIMKALTKLIHGRKLYADNNPRLKQFTGEFEKVLKTYFESEDELVLTIEPGSVRWGEDVVYENDKREDSIAYLLHRDGVGEITLEADAVGDETSRLVDILADEFHNPDPDDDVVTRFWNADFESISYRVLDDYLSAEGMDARSEAQPAPESPDQAELRPSLVDRGRVIVQQSDPLESIDSYLRNLIMQACDASEPEEREAYFQSMVASFFSVSRDELATYHNELAREKQSDTLTDFFETLTVFLLMHENPSAVRDVTGVLERIVEYCLEECEPESLSRLLAAIVAFSEREQLPESTKAFCDDLLARLSSHAVVTALTDGVHKWDKRAREVMNYVCAVGPSALDPVMKVLHRVDSGQLHKEICAVIVKLADGDIGRVIDMLDIDNPSIAHDAVTLAIDGDLREITPKMRELIHYPDRRVKLETMTFLSRLDSEESSTTLLAALDDDDMLVRCRALEMVAERGGEHTRSRIEALAFSKELGQRESDEQEAIFKALGRVGDSGTVAQIETLIEKKGKLWQFGKGRENKLLAIRALERIGETASLRLLKKMSDDGNSLVSTRAKRAYTTLKNMLDEEEW